MANEPTSKDQLPDDLVAFLKSNRILEYDPAACESGLFTIRSFEEIEEIQMVVRGEDGESSCTIRALDLVKSCEGYDPRGMFVFIPALRKYGSYDGEHEALITFRGMSWSDFLADPARYVNAAWTFDPEIAEATFSEAAVDRLVEVYSAENGLEAHSLRFILEDKGIRTQVVGESLQAAGGDLPLGATLAPRVWVREGDARRAREIIETHSGRPRAKRGKPSGPGGRPNTENVTFACQECGKSVTFGVWRCGHVENCPHCGSYVDVPDVGEEPCSAGPTSAANEPCSEKGEPSKLAVAPQRTSRQLWLEVLAILAVAYVPYLFSAVGSASGWLPRRQPSPYDSDSRAANKQEISVLGRMLIRSREYEKALPLFEQAATPGVLDEDTKRLIECAQLLERHDTLMRVCAELRETGQQDNKIRRLAVFGKLLQLSLCHCYLLDCR